MIAAQQSSLTAFYRGLGRGDGESYLSDNFVGASVSAGLAIARPAAKT